MAVLTDNERKGVWAGIMRILSRMAERIDLNKPELQAAIDGADAGLEAVLADLNTSLPAEARGKLSSKQKLRLYKAVIEKRIEVA